MAKDLRPQWRRDGGSKPRFYDPTSKVKKAVVIAAAPDLLEALKEAADEVYAAGGNRSINLDSMWLEKARAAIAKATGA